MRHFFVSGALCALLAVPAMAQFENGEVLGTVRDATGSVVARAAITLTNQDTNISAKTVTDESGNYLFPNVKDRPLHRDRRDDRDLPRHRLPISRSTSAPASAWTSR